jgi:hypothetical protein
MRARTVAFVLVAVLAVYLVLVGWRGLVLVQDGFSVGDPLSLLLGVAVLVFPVVGAWLVWREVRFGVDTQHLAEHLAGRGALPVDDVTRRPSGRPDRQVAAAALTDAESLAADHPDDPASWYRLALAHDDSGDRRRARAAMRHAVAVWRSAEPEGPQPGSRDGGDRHDDEERGA